MTLEVITRQGFAREMGLPADAGEVAEGAVADLLRRPLARWGLSPRRAVVRSAREQIEAAGLSEQISSEIIGVVLDRLTALGECTEVNIRNEPYVMPSLPRWIPTGQSSGVLLSVGELPPGLGAQESTSHDDIVRRIRVDDDDDLAALHSAGIRRCEFEEWLRPLDYLRHARRRLGHPVRGDLIPIESFWKLLTDSLTIDGQALSDDAEVRILTGPPGSGSFFGRYDSDDYEGRWTREAEDGVWCAYRPGFGDKHWHPIIVSVDGSNRRAFDLYDHDEWRWALLARGRATQTKEKIVRDGLSLKLTFPPAPQLSVAMDMLGPANGPWSWLVPEDAPDLWSQLL